MIRVFNLGILHTSANAWVKWFVLILYIPVNNFSVILGQVFLGWTSTKQEIISFSRKQRSASREARIHNPSISSQALYYWATSLLIG